jgi:hypothetical protein
MVVSFFEMGRNRPMDQAFGKYKPPGALKFPAWSKTFSQRW